LHTCITRLLLSLNVGRIILIRANADISSLLCCLHNNNNTTAAPTEYNAPSISLAIAAPAAGGEHWVSLDFSPQAHEAGCIAASVGEQITVIEKTSDTWFFCRNAAGYEGYFPAESTTTVNPAAAAAPAAPAWGAAAAPAPVANAWQTQQQPAAAAAAPAVQSWQSQQPVAAAAPTPVANSWQQPAATPAPAPAAAAVSTSGVPAWKQAMIDKKNTPAPAPVNSGAATAAAMTPAWKTQAAAAPAPAAAMPSWQTQNTPTPAPAPAPAAAAATPSWNTQAAAAPAPVAAVGVGGVGVGGGAAAKPTAASFVEALMHVCQLTDSSIGKLLGRFNSACFCKSISTCMLL
jgi:hypothetical protein